MSLKASHWLDLFVMACTFTAYAMFLLLVTLIGVVLWFLSQPATWLSLLLLTVVYFVGGSTWIF
jgi:hypothetical protein